MIREARLDDLDSICHLEAACFEEPWNRRMVQEELKAADRICLVDVEGGDVVGYLLVMQILEELHVNKIGVSVEWRRRGVARELMRALEAIALERTCESMSLEVREPNHVAREFYRSLGFDEEYVRRRYYANGDDAIIMTKKIEN